MAFDASQINDARLNALYNALDEEGELRKSMVRQIATVVPKSQIPTKAAKMKVLDIRNVAGSTDLGYGDFDAASTEVDTQLNDRSYDIEKISGKKTYARGLEGDVLFQKIKQNYMPDLDGDIKVTEDSHLATILKAGGSSANSDDVSNTDLSAGSNEVWSDEASDPLNQLKDGRDATMGNELILGSNKAFELKMHPQLQSATGMKYLTSEALADYLSSFLDIPNVWIEDKYFHNGVHTATLNVDQVFKDVAYIGRKGNILFLDWEGQQFETDADIDTDVATFVGRSFSDIITVDPNLGMAFVDVA